MVAGWQNLALVRIPIKKLRKIFRAYRKMRQWGLSVLGVVGVAFVVASGRQTVLTKVVVWEL